MGRKYISQKKQTKEEMFDALIRNAIYFLDSSLDNLNTRPKHSIIDFYTSIELFMKARLLSEHWTLILSKPELANLDSFNLGDFQSIYLEEAVKRISNVLKEQINSRGIDNFKALGEHRNQIVHFAHTDYTDFEKTKAGVVSEQWASWHHLHVLIAGKWKEIFKQYLPEFERVHRRMLKEGAFLKARYTELEPLIQAKAKAGATIISCSHCNTPAGIAGEAHNWGVDYECMVCGVNGTTVIPTNEKIPCGACGKEFEFFSADVNKCPHCGEGINTDQLIDLCEKKYTEGDDWWEEGAPHIAKCHECKNDRPSVFYIDGLWSCVSCFDRGWGAITCPNCDEFVTGDFERIQCFACFRCEDAVSAKMMEDCNFGD